MAVKAILALGSNLGSSEDTLIRAIADICAHEKIRVTKISPIAITAPVGGPAGQPDYTNMVIEAEVAMRPFDLLDYLQSIENKHHRTREVRWGPRTLDIDIIDIASIEMDDPDLMSMSRVRGRTLFLTQALVSPSRGIRTGRFWRQPVS